MDLVEIFRFLHSWVRWLVLLVMVAALIYLATGWLQGREWRKLGQTLLTTFSSLIGLQWLLGLVFLVLLGSETGFGIRHYWEHLFAQTIAVGLAHVHVRWRRQDLPDAVRYRNGTLLIVVVLVVVVLGILALPEGIQWRAYMPG